MVTRKDEPEVTTGLYQFQGIDWDKLGLSWADVGDWITRGAENVVRQIPGATQLGEIGYQIIKSYETGGRAPEPSAVTRGGPPSATQAGQPGPQLGDQSSAFLQSANQRRQFFVDRRNAAIAAAGRGAGAPYAAQIARIDAEIAQAQQMLTNVGGLFGRKVADTEKWWDQSITSLASSYDDAISETETLMAGGSLAIENVFSGQQAKTLSILNNIPGMDESTKAAATDTVAELESFVMNMETTSGEGQLEVMQAAEDLAGAIAKQHKAEGTLAFVRERTLIEEQLKGQIADMIADRQAAQRAQAAASRAAREAEAARLPDNWAFDQTGMALDMGFSYLERVLGNATDAQQNMVAGVLQELYLLGVTPDRAYREIGRYLREHEVDSGTAAYLRKYGTYAIQSMYQGVNLWNSYKGQDPYQYPVNSAERAYAVSANNEWMSEDEKEYEIEQIALPQTTSSTRNVPTTTSTSGQFIRPSGH